MPKLIEITGPAFLASALINADTSGLDDEGEKDLAHFLKYAEGYEIFDVKRDENGEAFDSYFTWSYDLHGGRNARGGDVLDYLAWDHTEEGA